MFPEILLTLGGQMIDKKVPSFIQYNVLEINLYFVLQLYFTYGLNTVVR